MLSIKEQILELEKLYFKAFSNIDNYKYLVEIKEDRLVSYLLYTKVLDEAEVISILTKVEYRRQGLAKKLILRLQEEVSTIFLEVNEKNKIALDLYLACGFQIYNKRNAYYNNKDAAILLKWSR